MEIAMRTVLLIIFAVAAAVYLVSLFLKHGIFQDIAKSCMAPLILAIYISGVQSPYIPVIAALVFGWLGDVFLIKIRDVRFFRLGLASFLLGHICYILSMLHFSGGMNSFALILSLIIALPLGLLLHSLVRPSTAMNIPAIVYETVILLMAASALQLYIASGAPFGTLVFAGSLCFLASDSMLAYFNFRTKPRFGDFFVMLTYLAAQLCIVLGLSGF
jgi:uncharacterized membrane protein YhhN